MPSFRHCYTRSSGNSIMDLVDAEQDRKAKLREQWEREEEEKQSEGVDNGDVHQTGSNSDNK